MASPAYGNGGTMCGGKIGILCPEGRFCDPEPGICGADVLGLCVKIPPKGACPISIMPVCGCDGKAYPGDCERIQAGVAKRGDGPCVK